MNIINVIFRFFDFFIIIGCAVFCIQRYIIPVVEKMIKEYTVFLYNLESDCKNLQLTTQSIYEKIQDQDLQFQSLQNKFVHWQKKQTEQLELQIIEQQKIDQIMQQRFEIQSSFIKNDYIIKEQLPMILDTATKKLQLKYHAPCAQQEYLDALINLMKDRS